VRRTRSRARLAIGSPADGELAVTTARASVGSVYAVAEDEIVENISLLAENDRRFGETAPAVTLGALREARYAAGARESDRVVLIVTGDG